MSNVNESEVLRQVAGMVSTFDLDDGRGNTVTINPATVRWIEITMDFMADIGVEDGCYRINVRPPSFKFDFGDSFVNVVCKSHDQAVFNLRTIAEGIFNLSGLFGRELRAAEQLERNRILAEKKAKQEAKE